jgi:predicted kinase
MGRKANGRGGKKQDGREMNADTELVLCCGRVCSGKSTYARTLEAAGYFRFSADAWMLHFYEPSEDRGVFDAQLARCKAMIRVQAEKLLALGQSVVLDDGFWTRAEREETRRHFTDHGFAVRLEVFPVDLETQVLRSLQRQAEDGEPHFDFDEATIAVLNSFFEEPGVEELG